MKSHNANSIRRLDLENFFVDRLDIMAGVEFSKWDYVSMSPFCRGRLVALLEEYHFQEKNEKFIQLSILDLSTCHSLERSFR